MTRVGSQRHRKKKIKIKKKNNNNNNSTLLAMLKEGAESVSFEPQRRVAYNKHVVHYTS
jgi:hypothetical protein